MVVVAPKGDDPNALHCPRCATELSSSSAGATVVHGCPDCGGIWLDPRAVDHARNVNDEELLRVAFSIVGPVVRSRPDRSAQIGCPVCAATMQRVGILGGACDVDVCTAHGTWFDRTELDAFVKAHSEARAGEVTEEDLRAAGVEGSTSKGDIGFFGAMFEVAGLFK